MGITERNVCNASGLGKGHRGNGKRTTRTRYQENWTPRGTDKVACKGSVWGEGILPEKLG